MVNSRWWLYVTSFVMSSNAKCKEKNPWRREQQIHENCWLTDWLWSISPPPTAPHHQPTNVSMCAADDANAGCSLRPDHKPVGRSQQGGNPTLRKGRCNDWTELRGLSHVMSPVRCEIIQLERARCIWQLNWMDLAPSSRRSGRCLMR